MNGFSLIQMLIAGLILSVLLTVLIVGSLAFIPRVWYKRLPAPVRERVAPLTADEKRTQTIFALFFFVIPVVLLTLSTSALIARNGGEADFMAVLLNAYGILVVFNLTDWLIIDWLFVLVLGSYYIRFAGAEGFTTQEKFGTYGYHFRGFLIGLVITGVISLIVAGVAVLVA